MSKLTRIPAFLWRMLGNNNFVRTIAAGGIIILGGLALVLLFAWNLWGSLPDLNQLKAYEPRLTTRILDRNDSLLVELFTQRRLLVPLDRISPYTIDAILVTEDARFYDHWGFDMIGMMRAAYIDVITLSLKQGASTITQQLSRDLFLHKRRTFTRKIRETLTSLQIERNYSKREILEMYLTQIYFGHGAYGVGSAAAKYFSKPASELTLTESALLAALPKAPTHYSPIFKPDKALQRRNIVLHSLLSHGKITQAEYEAAKAEPLGLNLGEATNPMGTAPYFTEMIRQKLSEEGKVLGFDYLADGLTVRTPLDSRLQEFAELALTTHLDTLQVDYRRRFIERYKEDLAVDLYFQGDTTRPDSTWTAADTAACVDTVTFEYLLNDSARIDSMFSDRSVVQAALIALDPYTGEILAMIGGKDFAKYKFNRAVQAVRQPGSVFKPVAYTAAIDNGYPTTFELLNQDVVLQMNDSTRWVPQNYDHSHGGLTTLREALRRSLNLVTVRLVQEVVPPSLVVKYARQLGFTTPIAAVDAIALGASGVIPLEAVSAYCVFPNAGVHTDPRSILRIEDRFGDLIKEYQPVRTVALSRETSYIMTDLLQTVMNRGTGGSVRWKYRFYVPGGGKTGTTNGFTDAWFIGFTPEIACGVWVGLDDPSESLGRGYSGAVAALPIWARFMKMTYDSLGWEPGDFEMPGGVVRLQVCAQTKQIATPYCPEKLDEVFRHDARPVQECPIHRRIKGF